MTELEKKAEPPEIYSTAIELMGKRIAELKAKPKHDCPNCIAFGKHCPHKVNGDPYFYDCYLTVVKIEAENAELEKELIKAKEISKNLIEDLAVIDGEQTGELKTVKEAKQFLKETE